MAVIWTRLNFSASCDQTAFRRRKGTPWKAGAYLGDEVQMLLNGTECAGWLEMQKLLWPFNLKGRYQVGSLVNMKDVTKCGSRQTTVIGFC